MIERDLLVYLGSRRDLSSAQTSGFPNVVALMGSSLSDEQAKLLVESTDKLALLFDGDDAGVGFGLFRSPCYRRMIAVSANRQLATDLDEAIGAGLFLSGQH